MSVVTSAARCRRSKPYRWRCARFIFFSLENTRTFASLVSSFPKERALRLMTEEPSNKRNEFELFQQPLTVARTLRRSASISNGFANTRTQPAARASASTSLVNKALTTKMGVRESFGIS